MVVGVNNKLEKQWWFVKTRTTAAAGSENVKKYIPHV